MGSAIRFLALVLTTACVLFIHATAHGTIIAYDVSTPAIGDQNFGGSLGMDFDVQIQSTIFNLGVFDSGQDGLNRTITAQLYDRSNPASALVTETFTGMEGTPMGGSRFKDLAMPIVLPAGFEGTIVAFGYGPGEPNGNLGAGWLNPDLTPVTVTTNDGGGALSFVGTSRFCFTGAPCTTFPFQLDSGPAARYGAGTFAYEPVPEPGTLLLIGSGLVGVGVARRRRK